MRINSLFEGQRVRLTTVTDDDLPLLTRWYQDSVFHRLYDATPAYPHQQENRKQWLEERQKEKDAFIFALRTTDDNRFIGWAGIDGITWTHRSAWLSIAIGDPAKRGQGLGHEAMSLLLNFAFDELNLHRVQLTVFALTTRLPFVCMSIWDFGRKVSSESSWNVMANDTT